jgi:hypothetical protein
VDDADIHQFHVVDEADIYQFILLVRLIHVVDEADKIFMSFM